MSWTWMGGWWMPMLFMGLMLLMIVGCAVMMLSGRGPLGMMHGHGPDPDRSLAILRERYAKGELSQPEFDRLRKELG